MPRLSDNIQLPDGILIREVATSKEVVATLVALDRTTAKSSIDTQWRAAKHGLPQNSLKGEHDNGWVWYKDLGKLRAEVGNLGYGWAAMADGEAQGAILYQLGGVSELDPEMQTFVIYRLATAPWNRLKLRQPRLFAGAGKGLLRLAVYHSHQFGLGGRVTLEAYPDESLIRWYTDFGFRIATVDKDGSNILELAPEAAARHLERPK